ncbi:LPP20 lipoprotein [Sinobacterium caligoides]|uniref:LPP20 lipoprotein n=1 Tax=Sinobacterium caligoides TaxID=933926 RepID=A0A3N2DMV3_9GAMM|nr:LPP20 family lipoprotein [Sinobacterium caligoides]ROS01138.1 LPP20 lipoprotein [Sinobacterium caligoides]
MLNITALPLASQSFFRMKNLSAMKKTLSWALLATSAVLAGCSSSTGGAPKWLDGADANYPDAVYLIAQGEGTTRSVSDNRALANLAKVFEVSVADRSLDFSSAIVGQQSDGQGGMHRVVENKQEVSRFVSTDAQQQLRGAKIAERWQSEEGGLQHSLAVLEKAPAVSMFSQQIRAADQNAQRAVDYARNDAPNVFAALSALEQARQRQVARANDNNNLRVLTGTGISAKYSADDLETMIRQGLSQITVAGTGRDQSAQTALQAAIAKVGLAQGANSQYELSLALPAGRAERKQGWYWLRGNIQLSVIEAGTVIANKSWPFKVSAQSEAMLQQRLSEKLDSQLPGYIYQLMTPGQ